MRKVFVMVFITFILILLSACDSDSLLSGSLNQDIDQMLPLAKEAHEKQEDYSDKEKGLMSDFHDKYKYGQYYVGEDEEIYEMNDVEKAIFHEVNDMVIFAVDSDYDKDKAVLKSEEDKIITNEKMYDEAKLNYDELKDIKKVDKLPDEYQDKYPTYEIVDHMFPEQFKKDTNDLLNSYESLVNGDQTDVIPKQFNNLVNYLSIYLGDEPYPTEYKQDGKYYLVNDRMSKAIKMFEQLEGDIKNGAIESYTIDDFNDVKDTLNIIGD